MREIHLIDTTVFCRIVRVPGKCTPEQHKEAMADLTALVTAGATLLLPVVVIYETGNHIAQHGDGDARRKAALRFTTYVTRALDGIAPWTLTPLPDQTHMKSWLPAFPDWAMRQVGLGDCSIVWTYEQQRELNPLARVRIWTMDEHLSGYDFRPVSSLYPSG